MDMSVYYVEVIRFLKVSILGLKTFNEDFQSDKMLFDKFHCSSTVKPRHIFLSCRHAMHAIASYHQTAVYNCPTVFVFRYFAVILLLLSSVFPLMTASFRAAPRIGWL